jgi:hypothetical protein
MKDEQNQSEIYIELICELLRGMKDEKFIKQIYSIIVLHKKRTGS